LESDILLAERMLPMTTLPIAVAWRRLAVAGLLLVTGAWIASAQSVDITKGVNLTQGLDLSKGLDGFDDYMAKTLKDWNAPGVGVGIVVNDKLVFAKGYGYRDYEKKLPFTPATMMPIASAQKETYPVTSKCTNPGMLAG
jgi:CubicO group peptidase (beta-lactamase class C family)